MPVVNTVADYIVYVARLNLCTPTNILELVNNSTGDVLIKQAHQVLYSHGTLKERDYAEGWLRKHYGTNQSVTNL